jgi:hypothetical protein
VLIPQILTASIERPPQPSHNEEDTRDKGWKGQGNEEWLIANKDCYSRNCTDSLNEVSMHLSKKGDNEGWQNALRGRS